MQTRQVLANSLLLPSTTDAEIQIDKYNAKISGELPTFTVNWLCYKPILKTEN